MNAVIDANLVAAMALPLPYSGQATAKITTWKRAGTALLAPLLLEYELSAILRKAVVAGLLAPDVAWEAMRIILDLHIECLPPTPELHRRALYWADRLGQAKTYDAHYLAVAEQQQAELWTADRRLVNCAHQAGVTWLHWIGEGGSS